MNKRTRFLIFVLLMLMGLLPAYAQQGTGATRGAYWQQRGLNQNATRSILPPQTFTVNSTADAVDADLSDNLCAAADNTCTLRAAIQSANAAPGSAINIAAPGLIRLSITGRGEGAAATGDLDITAPVTITGISPTQTIISGGGIDGVFHIYNVAGTVRIANLSVIEGRNLATNTALITSGGVTIENSTVELDNLHIYNNQALIGAGVQVGGTSVATISNSTISGNTAQQYSGGIDVYSGPTLTLSNTTISGNKASTGGGVYIDDELGPLNVTVSHATIVYNQAIGAGGGLRTVATRPTSSVQVGGSIMAHNVATNAPDCAAPVIKPFVSLTGNIVTTLTGCRGLNTAPDLNIDPQLAPLMLNAPGTTPTHALKMLSPAVDAAGACTGSDQRGVARPSGAACDSGAYEQRIEDLPMPGVFYLVGPDNGTLFQKTAEFDAVRWGISQDATHYTLTLNRVEPDPATLIDNRQLVGYQCSTNSAMCLYELPADDKALITEGIYQWRITAHNPAGSVEATVNPFTFTIDLSLVSVLRNGSFEWKSPTPETHVANQWYHNRLLAPQDRVGKSKLLAYAGKSFMLFKAEWHKVRKVYQISNASMVPEVALMESGDMIYFDLFWRQHFIDQATVIVRIVFVDPNNAKKNIVYNKIYRLPTEPRTTPVWQRLSDQIEVPSIVNTPGGPRDVSNAKVRRVAMRIHVDNETNNRGYAMFDRASMLVDLEPEFGLAPRGQALAASVRAPAPDATGGGLLPMPSAPDAGQ